VNPESARLPIERLLAILHRLFEQTPESGEFRRGQFLSDLGQIVWDLYLAVPIPVSLDARFLEKRLRKVWQERPTRPGLDRIEVNNFRCLKAVKVELKPLTVLIGPNDSGKSAFLAAVGHLIDGGSFTRSDYWRENADDPFEIRGHSSVGDGEIVPGEDGSMQQIHDLRPVQKFHFPSDGVRLECAGHPDEKGAPEIALNGHGVPALFDYLLRQDRQRFFAAVEACKSLIPGLAGINVGTRDASLRRLDMILEEGFRLPADNASTGVRLLLTFVALAYHPTPPRVILLEEPETGVHPRRLKDIVTLIRQITEGDHGEYPAQVILTTHSPYLLNFINLETDQVLVFRRNTDGSRTAEAVDAERLKVFLDEFSLGEVWFNRGEEGMVAKKP